MKSRIIIWYSIMISGLISSGKSKIKAKACCFPRTRWNLVTDRLGSVGYTRGHREFSRRIQGKRGNHFVQFMQLFIWEL